MERRSVLRLLGSAAAISALPLEALTLLKQASAQVSQSTGVRTLNAHQNSTVITIAEIIIPETNTPGAKTAKVNEFIDLLLTEWYESAEKARFLEGLATIDAASRKRFGADFISCTAPQQMDLMKQFDDAAMQFAHSRPTHVETRTTSARTQKTPKRMPENNAMQTPEFFYMLKKLTLFGYYTSEIGFSQELGYSIIPPGHEGCAPLKESAQ
jgi:Gluconate 2-dehydrogenase subunit 3